jgi:hypothetical protein
MNASERDIAEQLTLIDFRVFQQIAVCSCAYATCVHTRFVAAESNV